LGKGRSVNRKEDKSSFAAKRGKANALFWSEKKEKVKRERKSPFNKKTRRKKPSPSHSVGKERKLRIAGKGGN